VKSLNPKIPRGYILKARTALSSDVLINGPPLRSKLWDWMLLKTNFKDHNKFKRGQLLTSISEMQAAMSYYVGYRKVTPSKSEIRNCYEVFMKAGFKASKEIRNY
jgi:hypothetical protein